MRRRFLGRSGALITNIAIGCAVLACSDPMQTDADHEFNPVPFVLSEGAAMAFVEALDDVRTRILPAYGAVDAPKALAPLLDELTAAIAARDQLALRRAVARTEAALATLAGFDDAATIGSELDVVRLILEQALPFADGVTGISAR